MDRAGKADDAANSYGGGQVMRCAMYVILDSNNGPDWFFMMYMGKTILRPSQCCYQIELGAELV